MSKQEDPLQLLTVEEVAELLKVSPITIYRWLDSGQLPKVKFSRRAVRIKREDLQRFIKDHFNDRSTPSGVE